MPASARGSLVVPVALVTVMIGMVLLITRAKAVIQVVGYMMLENSIYIFGLTLARRVPFLVEAGVLLDVFVGVFIMGIVIFRIGPAIRLDFRLKLTRAPRIMSVT